MKLRIKAILKERRIRIEDFAAQLGMSRQAMSSIINGTPNLSSLEKVATALDVPMWMLFASPKQALEDIKNLRPDKESEETTELMTTTCPHCGRNIHIKIIG